LHTDAYTHACAIKSPKTNVDEIHVVKLTENNSDTAAVGKF